MKSNLPIAKLHRASKIARLNIPSKKQRVAVGMSGGVDSSVAAHLLKEQGYDVIGLTMKIWAQDCLLQEADKCCGPQAVADARQVAHALGIPHFVVDESAVFEEAVISYFVNEYRQARTPNPCILCNEKIKFGSLMQKARELDADFVATGHYAVVEHPENGSARLKRGTDRTKDQSYFLFSLGDAQLRRTLMPLGGMTKQEIRAIAQAIGLKVHDKPDSQEICFVPSNSYADFFKKRLGENSFHTGDFCDNNGRVIGRHGGIELYTVGQRKGLPGGASAPRYVISIDPATRRVILGGQEDLMRDAFAISGCHWNAFPSDLLKEGDSWDADVQIRYRHTPCRATVTAGQNGTARIRLHEKQRAVTPGQAAVFYHGDTVLGGGWISVS